MIPWWGRVAATSQWTVEAVSELGAVTGLYVTMVGQVRARWCRRMGTIGRRQKFAITKPKDP